MPVKKSENSVDSHPVPNDTLPVMKKRISLHQAHHLVNQATALLIDGGYLAHVCIDNLLGDPANQWLFVSWNNFDDEPVYTHFIEEEQDILFDGSTLYMQDEDGEDWQLVLLVPMGKTIDNA